MTGPRCLVLLRHAKSGYPGGVRDHDRPLAERGRREGALAGEWIRANVPSIDEVLCSTAVRTRETVATAGLTAPIRLSGNIYEASPEQILGEIALTDPAVNTLLVVGHGPGLPGLALDLAGPASDEDALARLEAHFPTAAIAVFLVDARWADLGDQDGHLTQFHVARA